MIEKGRDFRKLEIDKIVANLQKQPVKDKRAQGLIVKWYQLGGLLASDQKDQIGRLWMTKILGVSEEVAKGFLKGHLTARREVGHHHAGIEADKREVTAFWNGVNEACPGFLTEEELEFLVSEDTDASGAWHMVCAFDGVAGIYLETSSATIRALVNNALDYK